MFGKKKNNNPFGDKNYSMKEKYYADELFVANFKRISSALTNYGPVIETTTQKFIFEKLNLNNTVKYREIFTGFITDCVDETHKNGVNFKYFDIPYVYEPQKFTDYFPEATGLVVPKLSLIWTLNDLNYAKIENINSTKSRKKK